MPGKIAEFTFFANSSSFVKIIPPRGPRNVLCVVVVTISAYGTGFGLNGKEAEHLLDSVNITVNKNSIPFETLSPFKTSGIRIGTPAITSRGFKEEDAAKVAELIVKVLSNKDDADVLAQVKQEVKNLTDKYPIYK